MLKTFRAPGLVQEIIDNPVTHYPNRNELAFP